MVIKHRAEKQAKTRSDIIAAHTHKYVRVRLFVHANTHGCAAKLCCDFI